MAPPATAPGWSGRSAWRSSRSPPPRRSGTRPSGCSRNCAAPWRGAPPRRWKPRWRRSNTSCRRWRPIRAAYAGSLAGPGSPTHSRHLWSPHSELVSVPVHLADEAAVLELFHQTRIDQLVHVQRRGAGVLRRDLLDDLLHARARRVRRLRPDRRVGRVAHVDEALVVLLQVLLDDALDEGRV